MELTKNEIRIIEIIRQMVPYERLEISKDQNGAADKYLIHRSSKIILAPTQAE